MQNSGAKKLLKKISLLLFPFVAWLLVEVFVLPMDLFTFRIWETISVNTVRIMSGPFYPNMHLKMTEEGELAPRTPFAKQRTVEWYTDKYGYRNRDTKAEVLIIGDSNITGAKLSQEETLAEVLEQLTGKQVYSYAPSTINNFLAEERFKEKPPEIVIVSSIERRIPGIPRVGENGFNSKIKDFTGKLINSSPLLTDAAITLDRLLKFASYRRTLADIDRAFGGKEYIAYKNEFFIEGEYANRDFSDEEIDEVVEMLEGYKQALAERGIHFMFMPIPNKENIYYQMLPSKKKPDFLPRLMAKLNEKGIDVVNTQRKFEQLYQNKGVALYPVDDAHWNDVAVEVAAHLVQKRIAETHLNSSTEKTSSLVNLDYKL